MIIDVHLNLPLINSIRGPWNVTGRERSAAWETYVEIITRLSPPPMDLLQRDVAWEINNLEELLNKMREILKKYGPEVGRPEHYNDLSFAQLSITIINVVLRPALAKGQQNRNNHCTHQELCKELDHTYAVLIDYCNLLAQGADVTL